MRKDANANSAVIPAKAGIQYAGTPEIESRGRGVLGRPVKPGDDSGESCAIGSQNV